MDTINISVKRVGSVMSKLMPYDVWFQGVKIGSVLRNKDAVLTIEKTKGILKFREWGSKWAFHSIEKEVVIFPEYMHDSQTIVCEICAKIYWLGLITQGLFGPIRKLQINVKY